MLHRRSLCRHQRQDGLEGTDANYLGRYSSYQAPKAFQEDEHPVQVSGESRAFRAHLGHVGEEDHRILLCRLTERSEYAVAVRSTVAMQCLIEECGLIVVSMSEAVEVLEQVGRMPLGEH